MNISAGFRCFLFSCALYSTSLAYGSDWTSVIQEDIPATVFLVVDSAVEISGDINPDQLGIETQGAIQYGVQGGGWVSSIAMLAGHAALMQAQRGLQKQQLIEEAKAFGRPLTESLKGLTYRKLTSDAVDKMFERGRWNVSVESVEEKSALTHGVRVYVSYNISRDRRALILNAKFESNDLKRFETRGIKIIESREVPYGDSENSTSRHDIYADLLSTLQEAIRVYLRRDQMMRHKMVNQRTLRSMLGGGRLLERGYIIGETCDRHVYENLTGEWTISRKLQRNLDDPLCKDAALPSLQ